MSHDPAVLRTYASIFRKKHGELPNPNYPQASPVLGEPTIINKVAADALDFMADHIEKITAAGKELGLEAQMAGDVVGRFAEHVLDAGIPSDGGDDA